MNRVSFMHRTGTYLPDHMEFDYAINIACFPEDKDRGLDSWDTIKDEMYCVVVLPKAVSGNVDWGRFRSLADKEECVGIGECGLDFSPSRKDHQLSVLRRQIALSGELGKTLMLHCRSHYNYLQGIGSVPRLRS